MMRLVLASGPTALLCVVILGMLSACAAAPPLPIISASSFTLKIAQAPTLDTQGRAVYGPGQCYVFLRQYPTCLLHEIRHCIEGNWHEEALNDDDCY
jgi:hypothetical protein